MTDMTNYMWPTLTSFLLTPITTCLFIVMNKSCQNRYDHRLLQIPLYHYMPLFHCHYQQSSHLYRTISIAISQNEQRVLAKAIGTMSET